MTITNLFSLMGGLALFLYGMDLMGKSLERQAGGRLQKILSRLTDSPLKGFLLGLAVTAVIQSSSATTVMVVGFVNSGIMQLHQAIGIIMGSNVGTTVTSWLLSLAGLEGDSLLIQLLKPSTFSPLLAFIGIILDHAHTYKTVVKEIQNIPEVVECHFVTGTYNIMVKLYCIDNDHLMKTIFDGILRVQGISTTQTYISLDETFQRQVYIDCLDF